jgi:hypothetical protein
MNRFWIAALALSAAACSPALNWRSVRVEGTPLTALLPCKPEQATRPVDLGSGSVELSLTGCEADGATFAISHLRLADASQAGAVLGQWRAAVLARMQAGAGTAVDQPFVPAGALALPQSVRTAAQGQRPGGGPVAAQAVWFARLEDGQMHLYHAVVYAGRDRPAVADAFFAGLALQ